MCACTGHVCSPPPPPPAAGSGCEIEDYASSAFMVALVDLYAGNCTLYDKVHPYGQCPHSPPHTSLNAVLCLSVCLSVCTYIQNVMGLFLSKQVAM